MIIKNCKYCGKEFIKRSNNHVCCDYCGNDYNVSKRNYKKNKHHINKRCRKYKLEHHLEMKISWNKWYKKNQSKIIQRRKTEQYKNNRKRQQENYRIKYPSKINAQTIAHTIPINNYCDICNSNNFLQRHHWRYDQPLLINTLCKDCHYIQHIKNFKDSTFGVCCSNKY